LSTDGVFSPEKKRERRRVKNHCPGGAAFSPQNSLPYYKLYAKM
jgi:hypothetical protein